MKNNFFLFCFFNLISSCNHSKVALVAVKTKQHANHDSIKTYATNNYSSINVTKDKLIQFFNIKKNSDSLNQLFFFENDDSIIWYDDKRNDWIAPLRWISVEEYELQYSKMVEQKDFSVLVLYNPAETSVDLFYKQKGEKVDRMIENKYFPNEVLFHQLNDTLLICQYYNEYHFGSALSDIRTYYFIGEKTGLFKYGYATVGEELRFESFVLNREEFFHKKNGSRILVRPDTLINLANVKKEIGFEPYSIYFGNVVLGK